MKPTSHDPETLRNEVRRRYGSIAKGDRTLKYGDKSEGGCCFTGQLRKHAQRLLRRRRTGDAPA